MSEKKLLTLQDIEKADDILTEDLYIPEWKGTIELKALTVAEWTAVKERSKQPNQPGKYDADKLALYQLMYGIVSPKMERHQVETLIAEKNAGVIQRIVNAIEALSRFGPAIFNFLPQKQDDPEGKKSPDPTQ